MAVKVSKYGCRRVGGRYASANCSAVFPLVVNLMAPVCFSAVVVKTRAEARQRAQWKVVGGRVIGWGIRLGLRPIWRVISWS